jgi:GDPmannose 4,6-dehydratase
MNKKRALITGITGMDGSYLTELLLAKDYEVYGIIRRKSNFESELGNVTHLESDINFEYGDLTDQSSLESIIMRAKPHEVYHLGAQSQVRVSFDVPQLTFQINVLGTLNVLESLRKHSPYTRMYNAATSEMFGNSITHQESGLNEYTPMKPVSPYGTSKLAAYNLCQNYRESYDMFISSGILFNHESPRRGGNFVTMKIVNAAWNIRNGISNKLELGNLDAVRDWGHAEDYVKGMHLMLQHKIPDDFILATGEGHTVRDFCKLTFDMLGMNYTDWVVKNPEFFRPNELNWLVGNANKAKSILNWEPKHTFKTMIEDMINNGPAGSSEIVPFIKLGF